VASDFMLSAISFAGLLLSFFVSTQLMAKDIDKKTIYIVLSKPLSRSQYILGKYLGLLFLVTVCTLILSLIALGGLSLSHHLYGEYFGQFRMDIFIIAIFGEWLVFALVNGLILFFASFSSSGFLTLLFSISVYIIGETVEEVHRYIQSATADIMMAESVSFLISGSRYLFPNFSLFDMKTQAAHGISVSLPYLLSITAYAVGYVGILLFLSTLIFEKRELT
jgi:ABC-type transport system involved in multi-copper enzyme maturation permease subunit